MKKSSFLSFFSLYLIYGLDLIGLVLVYVIFSPLILNPESNMLAKSFSIQTRNITIGALLGAYPLAQFFAAPILGEISDRLGRKKILLISTCGTIVSFALSATSIHIHSLILLFISRLISGIFAGNLTIAQAAVAGMAGATKKAQSMALFATVGGIAWTIGPFLGVLLSDSHLISFFGYATPFWFLTICFFINFLLIAFYLKESGTQNKTHSQDPSNIARNLLIVIKPKKVLPLFVCSISILIAWMMYQGFLATYLIEKYAFKMALEGYAYAFSSVFWFLGGLFANTYLLKYYQAKRQIILPIFVCALAILCFLIPFKQFSIWILFALANSSQAIITACFFALFAQIIPKNGLGKIFGLWNAGLALASACGPFLSSLLVTLNINLPYTLSACITMASGLFYIYWYRNFGKKVN